MLFERKNGYVLIQAIVYASIGIILIGALISWAGINNRSAREAAIREGAFQVAEAGVEYYRWHLAHSPLDFQDGTGQAGPYVHSYEDRLGQTIGQFTLTITSPLVGSTLVTIRSKGELTGFPNLTRTIEVLLAIPSLAKYAVVANDDMNFGPGTEIFGPIHSNRGIRFDGLAHNVVSSSLSSYNDPDHSGGDEYGVHTHITPADPLPPTVIPIRPDVFESGRLVSVPAIDFTGLTASLAQIKTDAQITGYYFPASGKQGYNIVLKTNDTFDLYKVDSTKITPNSGCNNSLGQDNWGTWSINEQSFLASYPFPANGLIFVEDNLWVEGQINSARLTIAAARFPEDSSNNRSITINNDLLYTNYDGRDVIGLIAQGNVNVGMISDNNLRIDAAVVAKNGRAGRYYYRPPFGSDRCSPYHERNSITFFGMIATNKRYGFAYTDGTGYHTRNITYDANLTYNPPPSFPLVGDQYQVISWTEVKN